LPIRIRTFIFGTVLLLLLVPTLTGGAAWLIERDHQQSNIRKRENTAIAYLRDNRRELQRAKPAAVQGFGRLLGRLDLLGQLIVARPGEKRALYVSPALSPTAQKTQAARDAKSGATPGVPTK